MYSFTLIWILVLRLRRDWAQRFPWPWYSSSIIIIWPPTKKCRVMVSVYSSVLTFLIYISYNGLIRPLQSNDAQDYLSLPLAYTQPGLPSFIILQRQVLDNPEKCVSFLASYYLPHKRLFFLSFFKLTITRTNTAYFYRRTSKMFSKNSPYYFFVSWKTVVCVVRV